MGSTASRALGPLLFRQPRGLRASLPAHLTLGSIIRSALQLDRDKVTIDHGLQVRQSTVMVPRTIGELARERHVLAPAAPAAELQASGQRPLFLLQAQAAFTARGTVALPIRRLRTEA